MADPIQLNRRVSDTKKADIEALIASEDDPKQRSFLIVLNSINDSLIANTRATGDLAAKFDEHLTTFEEKVQADAELLNQSKGAWKVAAWVLGVVQLMLLGAATHIGSHFNDIQVALEKLAISDANQSARIERLEQKK